MTSDYRQECEDLAAAFQWTAKINMHEAVANHFSLAVGDGNSFLINPNQKHFSLITASDILLLKTGEDPFKFCLLYTSPSPRDKRQSRMPSSA